MDDLVTPEVPLLKVFFCIVILYRCCSFFLRVYLYSPCFVYVSSLQQASLPKLSVSSVNQVNAAGQPIT